MTFKEIQDLIKLVDKFELAEVKIKDGDFELSVRSSHYTKKQVSPVITQGVALPTVNPVAIPAAEASVSSSAPSAPATEPEEQNTENYLEVKSPIVGTFYRSASPDKPPYVGVGDTIKEGDVVCIIEAMKLFNEIESEVAGKIVKVMVDDASPVEYDQVLFLVDPKG